MRNFQSRTIQRLEAVRTGWTACAWSAQEITFKNLTGIYGLSGLSLDGKGIYVYTRAPLRGTSIYAGLNGETHTLWSVGSDGGLWFGTAIPSADGRHFALGLGTYNSNAWLLENF